jgi:N-acetylglucosamine malate deacetylase 1
MLKGFQKILILAPHTDDGEFGCGASINMLIDSGADVYYAAFSTAEEPIPAPFPKDILKTEVKNATLELGIKPENLLIFNYPVRNFAHYRQQILDDLVVLNRDLEPNLVFMPCLGDLHQDHSTIASEGIRAFKKTSILAYELPWNNMSILTQCFITVSETNLQRKIAALDCYNSQKNRNYASELFIRSLAITRGTQIGTQYAEVFEVIRWIINEG